MRAAGSSASTVEASVGAWYIAGLLWPVGWRELGGKSNIAMQDFWSLIGAADPRRSWNVEFWRA